MEQFTFKKLLLKLICFGLFLPILGCGDIFEEDISESEVSVFNPLSGFTTTENLVLFWWEELEGANNYKVQIVQGTFETPITFKYDSLVEYKRLNVVLGAGEYQWRIRAENAGYLTDWVVQSFVVKSTSDLTTQSIVFENGTDTTYQNTSNFSFQWFPIDSIQYYQIKVNLESNGGVTVINDSTQNELYEPLIKDEGLYSISVKAVNENSQSPFSTSYFYFDETSPYKASLISPIGGAILGDSTFNFIWTRSLMNKLTGEDDTILLASNNTFQNILRRDLAQNLNYRDSLGQGQYYWRIKSTDKAGNKTFSDVENFVIN